MADKPQYLTDEQLGIGKGDNEQAPKQYLKESDLGIEPPARGLKGWGQDIAATAVKGAIAVPEALVGLADIPTGGRVGKFLENEDGIVGFRPKQAREIVNDWHSDATKEAQRKFQEADGVVDKAATAIQNPSLIASAVGEFLPSMFAGGVAARGLMAATKLGQMGAKGAALAGASGEGITMAGSAAEQIRQETDDGLLTPKQTGTALATGVIGGGIGAFSGRLANKLGIGEAETMLAQGMKGIDADIAARAAAEGSKQAAKGVPRQVIEGAINEGLLEELPQSVAEQLLQNLALGKDWSDGLDEAVVLGTLSGGMMGAGAAGFRGLRESWAQRGQEQELAAQAGAMDGVEPTAPTEPAFETPALAAQTTAMPEQAAINTPAALRPEAQEAVPPIAAQTKQTEVVRPTSEPMVAEVLTPKTVQTPATPSQRLGLDPNAGALSAAAAVAVDSGATEKVQGDALAQAAAEIQDKKAGDKPLSRAAQVADPETGEVPSRFANWTDEELLAQFRNAQSHSVRFELAQEIQLRRELDLQDELDQENALAEADNIPDNTFASINSITDEGWDDSAQPEPQQAAPEQPATKGVADGAETTQAQQAEAQPAQAGRAQAGKLAEGLTNSSATTENDGAQSAPAARPQAQAQGEAQPVKIVKATKADLDHLFGVDKKRAAAIERVKSDKGAFFFSEQKAKDFVKNNGIADTHEVVQQNRAFYVKAKEQAAPVVQEATKQPVQSEHEQKSADKQADAPRIANLEKYALPNGSVSDSWRDKDGRYPEHPNFAPNDRQKRLISEVKKAREKGLFYTEEIKNEVASSLGVSDEIRAINTTGVDGGDFGYDIYHAIKALDAQQKETVASKIRAELSLKVGDQLGTLVFNDFKQTNKVEVVGLVNDGRSVKLKGKRGVATATFEADVPSVKYAIERAHEKGKRNDSYEEFIAGRAADKQAAEQPPTQSQQAQAATENEEATAGQLMQAAKDNDAWMNNPQALADPVLRTEAARFAISHGLDEYSSWMTARAKAHNAKVKADTARENELGEFLNGQQEHFRKVGKREPKTNAPEAVKSAYKEWLSLRAGGLAGGRAEARESGNVHTWAAYRKRAKTLGIPTSSHDTEQVLNDELASMRARAASQAAKDGGKLEMVTVGDKKPANLQPESSSKAVQEFIDGKRDDAPTVDEVKAEQAGEQLKNELRKAKKEAKPAPDKDGRTVVGRNSDGATIYHREDGRREYETENATIREPKQIRVTRAGVMADDFFGRRDDFMTAEELSERDGAAASSQAAPYQYFEEKTGIIRDIPAMTTRDGSLNEDGKRLAYTEWRDMSDNEKALFHETIAARQTRNQKADDLVRKEYARIKKTQLEGERTILSSNGKPYKTEAAAHKFIEDNDIGETHYASKVDGGWAAIRRTPSEMLTRENEKKGIEDYTTIQERIVGEMGLTQAWSQDAITDAQWEEIDKRVDAIQRQQRGLPAVEQPPQPATPPKTLKEGFERVRAKKAAEKAEKAEQDEINELRQRLLSEKHEVSEFSSATFDSWKRDGLDRGSIKGWTIFHHDISNTYKLVRKFVIRNEAGGGYVRGEEITGSFASADEAKTWVKENPQLDRDRKTGLLINDEKEAEKAEPANPSNWRSNNIFGASGEQAATGNVQQAMQDAVQTDHLTNEQVDQVAAIFDRAEGKAKKDAKPAPVAKPPSADKTRAKADLMNALADLGDIMGKGTRMNIVPEQEQKLLPVLTRVLDAAFRLGYHKFKDAAKFSLDQIRQHLGKESADAITLDHLQGAYIAMAGGKQGVDTKRAVIDVESKAEIEAHEAAVAEDQDAADNDNKEAKSDERNEIQSTGTQALEPVATRAGEVVDGSGRAGIDATDRSGKRTESGAGVDGAGLQGARSGGSGTERVHPPETRDGGGLRKPRRVAKSADKAAAEQAIGPDTRPEVAGEPASAPNVPAADFQITDETRLGQGGEVAKFNDNLAAIRTLKAIEEANRRATPEEQAALARYVGWGGLANAFPDPLTGEYKSAWSARGKELRELLDDAEFAAARRSTRNAHYTSKPVVQAMWKAVERLGFKGGLTLETSMGVGNFLGLKPQGTPASFIGVEYDSLTSRIAQALYPQATVLHSGFQDVPLADNAFALSIGNPPFGSESLRFQYKPELAGVSIHNQFFRASMDALRPGGIQAMVVSRFLMDAKDKSTRLELAKQAKLIAAIRLPDTAFKENARTEVVTDIIILQKLDAGEQAAMSVAVEEYKKLKAGKKGADAQAAAMVPVWVETADMADPLGGEPMTVNAYFEKNKANILGVMERSGSMQHGADITVRLDDPASMESLLAQAVERLPQNIQNFGADVLDATEKRHKSMSDALRIALSGQEVGHVQLNRDGVIERVVERETPEGGIEMGMQPITAASHWSDQLMLDADGHWYYNDVVKDAEGKPVKVVRGGKATRNNLTERIVFKNEADVPEKFRLGKTGMERLQAAVALRDSLKRQIVLETADAAKGVMDANRKELAKRYDAFVEKFGPVNRSSNLSYLMTMPDGGLIAALEVSYQAEITAERAKKSGLKATPEKAVRAPILSERVVPKYEPATKANSASDALAITLSERGRVDVERIAQLRGLSVDEALSELQAGEKPLVFLDPETQQWETADAYLSGNVRRKLNAAKVARADANVSALEAVQPEAWGAEAVTVMLGSTWVPPKVYADFAEYLSGGKAKVQFSSVSNTFTLTVNGSTSAARDWSSEGASVDYILGRLMNSQPVVVTVKNEDGKSVRHEEFTKLAQLKAKEISAEFLDWVFKDGERRTALVDLFNEKFNTRVVRQRDGSHLKLPGKVPDSVINMRRHQKNVIWRGITDNSLLMDHAVGAGKTFAAIARAMERRRMGLSKKPMIVVPNHLVDQWEADIYRLYPGAKVLAAGKKDFEKQRRRRLFGKIATGDWDIVVVPHSSFGFIGIDAATEQRFLQMEMDQAVQAVKDAEEQAREDGIDNGRRKPFGVKEAERLVEKIQTRMDKLNSGNKDRLLTFEQMGVDDLTVDEAHEFKNLYYSSRMTGVRGMGDKTGSRKANDLYNKVRALQENPASSVAFLTGTPISNSAVEMYTVMRYLAPQQLKDMGLEHFDAWRAQFVEASAAFEPTESGSLKEVTRLGRSWSNMRSLMDLYYEFTDAVSLEDIQRWYSEDNGGKPFPVPKVKGGERKLVNVKPTAAQEEELQETIAGFDGLKDIQDPYERNAARLRLMDRARKLSLDVRAVDPRSSSDEAGGKLDRASQEIKRIYDQWSADRGAQMVFLDRSVPKAKGDDKVIKEYDALVAKRDEALAKDDTEGFQNAQDALDKFDANEISELRNAQAGGWNAYQQIKDNLIAMGVPANEIRFIQEANNDEQKQALFDAVNSGQVRVLIGSSQRMGAGTNAQKRLVGLHHIDVTWKPSDIEQREGRIIRQGNELLAKYGDSFEVEILAYATERTVDAKMWDLNATKLKTINGIRKYDGAFSMDFEDEDSVSMAEMAALASGNPLLLERVKTDSEINMLELQERAFRRRMYGAQDALQSAQRAISQNPNLIERAKAQEAVASRNLQDAKARKEARKVEIEGKEYDNLISAYAAAKEAIEVQQAGKANARYSVAVDGKRVSSKEAIDAAIGEALGDASLFEAEIGGRMVIQRTAAARELAARLNTLTKGIVQKDSRTETVGSMMGFDLVLDSSAYSGHDGNTLVDSALSLVSKEGETVTSLPLSAVMVNQSYVTSNLTNATTQLFNSVERLAEGYGSKQLQRQLDRAKTELPELQSKVGQSFPKAEELAAKRERLRELVSLLDGSKAAPVEDSAETTGDAAPNEDDAFFGGDQEGEYPTDAQRQFEETSKSYGGQDAYAKAKADGKTKLNYSQWVQVRTPNFKAWFGDWENDHANASKVVDSETGEPLVVYHGTGADFDAFSEQSHRSTLNDKYQGDGFHFSADPRVASQYADAARNQVLNKDRAFAAVNREMPPKAAAIFREVVEDGYAKSWDKPDAEVRAIMDESEAAGIDLNELLDIAEWVEGSNYNKGSDALDTFDAGMIFGGSVRYLPEWVRNDAVKLGIADALPNPSVMPAYLKAENVLRTDDPDAAKRAQADGYDGVYYTGPGTVNNEPEWIVFRPEQIKSATGNNGNFDPENDDITYFGQKSKAKQSGSKVGTPTDRAVMDMVRDGKTAEDVLRLIAGTSRSKFNKQVARLLLKTGAAPSVHIVGDLGSKGGFKHLAKYSRKNHALSMTEAATGRAEQIFLHEMIHAATLMALDRKSLPSVQMRVLFNHVKKQGGAAGQYGMTNVGEFVSEAFTNPKFQQALRGMKAPAQSPLHSAWDYLVRTIKSILGLPHDSTDALSAALEIGVSVMRENMALRKRGASVRSGSAYAGSEMQGYLDGKPYMPGTESLSDNLREVILSTFNAETTGEKVSKTGEVEDSSDIRAKSLAFQALAKEEGWHIAPGTEGDKYFIIGREPFKGYWSGLSMQVRISDHSNVNRGRYFKESVINIAPDDGYAYDTFESALWKLRTASEDEDGNLTFGGNEAEYFYGTNEDDDIAYFGAAEVRDIKTKAIDQLDRVLSHPGKVSLWDKTVGTMRHLAEREESFKPVFETAQGFIDDVSMLANDAADRAPRLLPRVEGLGDIFGRNRKKTISAQDSKAVAAPLFQGTLNWGRDLDGKPAQVSDLKEKYEGKSADEKAQMMLKTGKLDPEILKMWQGMKVEQYEKAISSRFENTFLKGGVVWKDAELVEHFNATPQQISLYREARAAIDRSIDMTARADMLRLLGEDYEHLRDVILDAPSLDQATALLLDTLEEDAKADFDSRDRLADLMHGVRQRQERANDLMKAGYAPLSRFGRYTVDVVGANGKREYFGMFESMKESNAMFADMKKAFPNAEVKQGTISQEEFKLFAGVTPESLELFGNMLGLEGDGNEARDKAFQKYLQLTKNNHSALKRLIHRQGIAGYSEDVGRVLASFVYSNARQAAGGLSAGKMERAISEIPKGKGELRDVAMGLRSYIQDPQEEGQAIRGMLFAQYLGGSVASAMVNMTQPFAVTMPYLSQFGGMAQSGAHLAKALKDMATKGFKYETDLANAMQHAEDDGIVSPQEIHQLMGQARGAGGLRVGDGTKLGDAKATAANNWEKLKVLWGQPFALAEQFNRRSTFIAAFRIAKEQGMANPAEFARKAVLDTQFLFSKANKPKWARGAIGGTLFTFKSYSVSYLELLQRTWNAGAPGSPERKAGRRAVAWSMAMLMMMGGAGGLPFMEDLEDLIDGIAQMMGLNFSTKQKRQEFLREYLGKEASEFIENGMSGIPGAPIDVSGRLGMGNLIPGTGLLLTKQNRERDLLEVLGPAGDLVKRGFTGAGKALTGDIAGAAMEVSPSAVRNVAKGWDMGWSGMYKDAKGYKVIDTTLDEAIAKAAGFQPRSVAEIQEANSFMMRSKSFYSQTSGEIKAQWADAIFRKDDAALERVRERLAAWNRDNPDQPIVVKIPDIMKRVREMGKDRTQRIADTAPKALRAQMRDMAREASM